MRDANTWLPARGCPYVIKSTLRPYWSRRNRAATLAVAPPRECPVAVIWKVGLALSAVLIPANTLASEDFQHLKKPSCILALGAAGRLASSCLNSTLVCGPQLAISFPVPDQSLPFHSDLLLEPVMLRRGASKYNPDSLQVLVYCHKPPHVGLEQSFTRLSSSNGYHG